MPEPSAPKSPAENWMPVVVGSSAVLYLASLALPALFSDPPMGNLTGWDCLLNGWYGVRNGYLAWLANLAYVPLLVTCARGRWRSAATLGALFTGLALLSFQFVTPALDLSSSPEPEFDGLGVGFWLWLSSGLAPLTAALIFQRSAKSQPDPRTRHEA